MTIAEILKGKGDEVVHVHAHESVHSVVRLLAERRIGCVPVVDNDRVVGIFSERDLVYRVASEGAAVLDRPVSALMTAPAITISPETPVLHGLSMMTKRRIRHLPVVVDERLVGLVSIGDLVKYRIERIESEAESLRTYIQSV
ncbi:CBS domain-containing protein [Sphingobium fontiphilum]|uniref:CBS domain-containing protein n=1 Tax=Sphingobium fontiphilum TaxID=944425 RepID=A0A7W6DJU3_9SPHN|nr:CBS domain-containing protein [Sphingobium fontiphilum]MBB3982646.1 CBS domain-containing protein [Sphingobium fontiphilum]